MTWFRLHKIRVQVENLGNGKDVDVVETEIARKKKKRPMFEKKREGTSEMARTLTWLRLRKILISLKTRRASGISVILGF